MQAPEVQQPKHPRNQRRWRTCFVGVGLLCVLAWFGRTHPSINTSGWGFLALIGIGLVTWFVYEADTQKS
jgi:hypothetical protein